MWDMTLKEIRDYVESQMTLFDLTLFLAGVSLGLYFVLVWEQWRNRKRGE